jgi:hypothetical protein
MPLTRDLGHPWIARLGRRLRHDGLLLAGVGLAVLVAAVRPLGRWFALAESVGSQYDLSLLPALIVLLTTFILHQQKKRHEAGARAATADAEARSAREGA